MAALVFPGQTSLLQWSLLYCLVKQASSNDRSCIAWSNKPPAMVALVLPGQASLLQWLLLYCLVKQASCNGRFCIAWSSKPPAMAALVLPGQAPAMTTLVFPGHASLIQWPLLYCLVKQTSNDCSCIAWLSKPPAMDKCERDCSKSSCSICVFIISTYTDGSPPESANWFCQWLSDTACDFRVPKTFLSGLHYTVFGLGDSLYGENYNKVGKGVFEWLEQRSAIPVFPLGLGDQNVAESKNGGIDEDFEAWKKAFAAEVFPVLEGRKSMEALEQQMMSCGTESCACKSKDGPPTDASPCCRGGDTEDPAEELYETSSDDEEGGGGGSGGEDIMDLEDMGKVIRKAKVPKDPSAEPKEMVTPQLRETLTKQGLS
eukprot:Em0015g807a